MDLPEDGISHRPDSRPSIWSDLQQRIMIFVTPNIKSIIGSCLACAEEESDVLEISMTRGGHGTTARICKTCARKLIQEMIYHVGISGNYHEILRQKLFVVNNQREEIIEAFIAKHGFEPDDCVQIMQRMDDGSEKYFLRRRTDEERLMLSQMSAQL